MKVVLVTNVLISGIFFGELPRTVLDAWAEERYELLVSPLIFDEYVCTCDRLSASHPGLEYPSILASTIGHGTLVPYATSSVSITADPDDDKFMLCARVSGAIVVSGVVLADTPPIDTIQKPNADVNDVACLLRTRMRADPRNHQQSRLKLNRLQQALV